MGIPFFFFFVLLFHSAKISHRLYEIFLYFTDTIRFQYFVGMFEKLYPYVVSRLSPAHNFRVKKKTKHVTAAIVPWHCLATTSTDHENIPSIFFTVSFWKKMYKAFLKPPSTQNDPNDHRLLRGCFLKPVNTNTKLRQSIVDRSWTSVSQSFLQRVKIIIYP